MQHQLWQIVTATCCASGMSREELLGPSRSHESAKWRQAGMVLARRITGKSLPSIGKSFNRDHTTVIHALERLSSSQRVRVDAAAEVILAVLNGEEPAAPPAPPPKPKRALKVTDFPPDAPVAKKFLPKRAQDFDRISHWYEAGSRPFAYLSKDKAA